MTKDAENTVINKKVYDENGNVREVRTGSLTTVYEYNRNNRVTRVENKAGTEVLEEYSYTYDYSDRMKTVTSNEETTTYTYNSIGQVSQVQYPNRTVQYVYDNAGNRIRSVEEYETSQNMSIGGVSENYIKVETDYEYSRVNTLLKETASVKDVAQEEIQRTISRYGYDANGNTRVVTKAKTEKANAEEPETESYGAYIEGGEVPEGLELIRYSYDGYNRLVKTEEAGGRTVEYSYRGDDLRAGKKVTSGETVKETEYVYDRGQLIRETTNGTAKEYAIGLQYIGAYEGGSSSYFMYNGRGDVTRVTGSSGTALSEYSYDIFGNAESAENDGNNIRYAGEYYDSETEQYYLRARYYTPGNGRFLTEDSYGGDTYNPQTLNRYTYCTNDPVNLVDPSGHDYEYVGGANYYGVGDPYDSNGYSIFDIYGDGFTYNGVRLYDGMSVEEIEAVANRNYASEAFERAVEASKKYLAEQEGTSGSNSEMNTPVRTETGSEIDWFHATNPGESCGDPTCPYHGGYYPGETPQGPDWAFIEYNKKLYEAELKAAGVINIDSAQKMLNALEHIGHGLREEEEDNDDVRLTGDSGVFVASNTPGIDLDFGQLVGLSTNSIDYSYKSVYLVVFAGITQNSDDTNFATVGYAIAKILNMIRPNWSIWIKTIYPFDGGDGQTLDTISDAAQVVSLANNLSNNKVKNMSDTVREYYKGEDYIYFVGYSGGGVAAVRTAEYLDNVKGWNAYIHKIIRVGSPQMQVDKEYYYNRVVDLYRQGDAIASLAYKRGKLFREYAYPRRVEITNLSDTEEEKKQNWYVHGSYWRGDWNAPFSNKAITAQWIVQNL